MGTFKTHPFEVQAYFERSLVLTFAMPKESLGSLIPPCLSLDTYKNTYGFIALALVQTKSLRPKGFPAALGKDFFLIGYRIFVKYKSTSGKTLRGLYILKSETDKLIMKFGGNLFTNYKYSLTDVITSQANSKEIISSMKSNIHIEIDRSNSVVEMPKMSPFEDWKEARKYAGPLPFTFTYDPALNKVLIIQGVRQFWNPKPVSVLNEKVGYFESIGLSEPILASSFEIKNVPYLWKKGIVELWKPEENP